MGLDSRSRSGIPTAKSIRRWYEQFNVSWLLGQGSWVTNDRGMSYAKLYGATETVTADRYMNVLTRFWRALGRFCGHEARGQKWFMQDGAASSYGKTGLGTWLTDHFEGRVISRFYLRKHGHQAQS
ncbi:hypothetical protein RRG08_052852 [Elysia crispata]|uniref:Uncharacterized protein n=1 Tax=Elysia crispata TaxID=231223 RepID=A0AAE0ZLA4_9GAST|nr:hypothetical protein RRG08_052852 [Elysia crispata]